MRWLWIGAAVLLAVAALSVFWAFQRPDFVAGLTTAAVAAVVMAFLPNLKGLLRRKSPEAEAEDHRLAREGKSGGINRGRIHK